MSPAEYRAALDRLGISANEFARVVGMDRRIACRMCRDDDPGPTAAVAFAVKAMLAFAEIKRALDARTPVDGIRTAHEICQGALRGEFDE